jgi:hypothetical protein
MLLVVDQTQDVYLRAKRWTDVQMAGSGFVGRWVELRVSYRTPPAFIPYLRQFVATYLDDPNVLPPTGPGPELDLYPIKIKWIQIPKSIDAARVCVEAALGMPALADPTQIAFSDVTMIVGSNRLGLNCVRLLQEKVRVAHTFGETRRQRRHRKRAFFMGDGRIKATTIHSFKGWEARCLVVHIGRAKDQKSLSEAYVALSRLRRSHVGSFLTVVCSAPELEAYGHTWPTFERLDETAAAPLPTHLNVRQPDPLPVVSGQPTLLSPKSAFQHR